MNIQNISVSKRSEAKIFDILGFWNPKSQGFWWFLRYSKPQINGVRKFLGFFITKLGIFRVIWPYFTVKRPFESKILDFTTEDFDQDHGFSYDELWYFLYKYGPKSNF